VNQLDAMLLTLEEASEGIGWDSPHEAYLFTRQPGDPQIHLVLMCLIGVDIGDRVAWELRRAMEEARQQHPGTRAVAVGAKIESWGLIAEEPGRAGLKALLARTERQRAEGIVHQPERVEGRQVYAFDGALFHVVSRTRGKEPVQVSYSLAQSEQDRAVFGMDSAMHQFLVRAWRLVDGP
jgi:hypothetical protein